MEGGGVLGGTASAAAVMGARGRRFDGMMHLVSGARVHGAERMWHGREWCSGVVAPCG